LVLRCLPVQPFLALAARFARPVLVWAALPLPFLAPTPRMQPGVVCGTEHHKATIVGEGRPAFCERVNVVELKGAPTASGQVR